MSPRQEYLFIKLIIHDSIPNQIINLLNAPVNDQTKYQESNP